MAFGEILISKNIALNAPKYKKVVEPFADGGTFAFETGKKKPKEHIINIEDETLFNIFLFLKNLSSSDKKKLKSFDWVGTEETFDKVVSIGADKGPEFYYRFFYLKHFSVRQKDPEATPIFDWMKTDKNVKNILFDIPQMKNALKKTTITNDDAMAVMGKASGSDTFLILIPKNPEHVEVVESKLSGLSVNYYYAKKIKSNDEIIDAAEKFKDSKVSEFVQASIMMASMRIVTNYNNKMIDLGEKITELGVSKNENN